MPVIIRFTEDARVGMGQITADQSPHLGRYLRSFGCTQGIRSTASPNLARRFEGWGAAREFILNAECEWGHDWDYGDDHNRPILRYSQDIIEVSE